MKSLYDIELRILLSCPCEGFWRCEALELDIFSVAHDQRDAINSVYGQAKARITAGTAQFRMGNAIPAGLVCAYINSGTDEEVAMDSGAPYRGALARVIHLACEGMEVAA